MGTRGQEGGHWFIVQCNPNSEKKAVSEIRRAGFRAYLPKRAVDFRHHRTKLVGVKRRPALVGYVFMRFPGPANWYALRQCQGVKGVLYCDGHPYRLPSATVASIMRLQRRMAYDTDNARILREGKRDGVRNAMTRARFKPGDLVRKADGPLARIIARIERVTDSGKIVAIADMMGIETPVEYDDADGLEVIAA